MLETIQVSRRDGGLFLDNDRFPPRCGFSRAILQATTEIRPRGEFIHVKLANARAVYRVAHEEPAAVWAELMYEEYR